MPIDRTKLGDDIEGDKVLRRQAIKLLSERVVSLQKKLAVAQEELNKYKDELLELEQDG